MPEVKMPTPMPIIPTEKEEKNSPIAWRDLCDYIGKPVYDAKMGEWKILHGYKQYGRSKVLYLSDMKNEVDFKSVDLYESDVNQIKTPVFPTRD